MLSQLRRTGPASRRQLGACFSSGTVDELLRYVRSPAALGNPEQVVDILRSGASHQEGSQAGRIHVALAETALDRGNFDEAAGHAEAACQAVRHSEGSMLGQDIQMAARELALRAFLTKGDDGRAFAAANSALDAAKDPGFSSNLTQRWRALSEATAQVGISHMATGDSSGAGTSMQQVHRLLENTDPAVGPIHGEHGDNYALPMIPRDLGIPSALLRYGIWAFTQGDRVQSARYLQRSAMASEALHAQAEAAGELLLTPTALSDTTLAAFSGHVQTELVAAASMQAWKETEVHLENALKKAEAIGGGEHFRLLPTLVHLAEVFSRTGRVTLAEGLYRKAAKMLYRNPTPGAAFVPRRSPLPVHSSLAVLLSWRYAQLLSALPKRGSEARDWQQHAEALYGEHLGASWKQPIWHFLGEIQALQGKGAAAAGVVVDGCILRVIPCSKSLHMEGRRGSDTEHEDADVH